MQKRESLLGELNNTILELLAAYKNMADPEILVYEGWTAKDILGHVVFWHESFARNIHDMVNDVKPIPLRGKYSELNQRCLDEMRPQAVGELLKRLEIAHRVIQENILDPRLLRIPYKKGSRDYAPEEHLDIVNKHIKGHLSDISKVII